MELSSNLFSNFSVQTPEERITRPVIVQIIIVSMKGSNIDTMPSSIGFSVLEEACAIGADPCPASLEYKPLLTPLVKAAATEAPKKPPTAAVGVNTCIKID